MKVLHRAPKVPAGIAERGSWEAALARERTALVAHYSRSPRVSLSVERSIEALRDGGFGVALISTSEAGEPLQFASSSVTPDLVVRRPNLGYDFGSWAWALGSQPQLGHRRTVLVNDSLAGPFASIRWILETLSTTRADVWGLIASAQFSWHLQSYFIAFAPGVLADPALQRFWRRVRPLPSKSAVIMEYELGLSRLLMREGFTLDALVPPGLLVEPAKNPAICAWSKLLDMGIPFVKRELIRDPSVAPDAEDIPGELQRRFGIDVQEWM